MADVLRIFFDTEFTSLDEGAKLISIGLVDETGQRTLYAELTDTWKPEDVGDFAKAAVIPLLDGETSQMSMPELEERLSAWLAAFNAPVVLATDSLAWDWKWMKTIFQQHGPWPENLVREPLLLTMNYLNDFDRFEAAVEDAFAGGMRRHHALDDARANRVGWIAGGGDILQTS